MEAAPAQTFQIDIPGILERHSRHSKAVGFYPLQKVFHAVYIRLLTAAA
jgi:hypothetical protein